MTTVNMWRALAGMAVAAAGSPVAAQINAPVPIANYITFAGNDWAWASPCPPSGSGIGGTCGNGSAIDLTYQSTQGWRLFTAAEKVAVPSVSDFGTAGNFKCASAYFTSAYTHCDYSDAAAGYIYGTTPLGDNQYAETWVVRASAAVPEPATWAMFIGGFGLVGSAMRRRKTKVAFA